MRSTTTCRPGWNRRALLAPVLLAFLGGCSTTHQPYRTTTEAIDVLTNDLRDPEARRRLGRTSLERHESFTLGIVEFDDQGYYWDRRQVDALEAEVRRQAGGPDEPGVLLNVFVHGWRHTADVCDGNLCCFRESLRSIARDQSQGLALSRAKRRPQRIFGVYVGWRGLSKKVWPLEQLSFLSRKNAALKVGSGNMTEFLTRLDRLRRELNVAGKDRSRLVVTGHSLGATVVYTALSGVLKNRLAEARPGLDPATGRARVIRGFGDLVLLVNPAFDAAAFHPLWEMVSTFSGFSQTQVPILVVVASETDSATRTFFPFGQAMGTLLETTRDAEQGRALRTAVGNYEPFVSYRLTRIDVGPGSGVLIPEPKPRDCNCSLPHQEITETEAIDLASRAQALDTPSSTVGDGESGPSWGEATCEPARPLGRTLLTCVKPVRRGNPIWVVSAAPGVLHGHGGFYNPVFGDFLHRLLLGGASATP